MKTVWKYVLDTDAFTLKKLHMPPGATPLRVGMQGPDLCLWAQVPVVELGTLAEERFFFFSGTGHEVKDEAVFVGSCSDAPYEWHVWELP